MLDTDCKVGLAIGLTSTLWTAAAIKTALSAAVPSGDFHILPTSSIPGGATSGMASTVLPIISSAPIIIQAAFSFWVLSIMESIFSQKMNRTPRLFWAGSKPHGPFDWRAGLPSAFRWFMDISIFVLVAAPSLASMAYKSSTSSTQDILNLLSLVLFLSNRSTLNPYTTSLHRYMDDNLRIALPTTHHEGTVYILPGPGTGIDAVWSPKLPSEHATTDSQIMTLFSRMRSDRWLPSEPLERLRTALASFQARTSISAQQAERLASWIYLDKECDPSTRRIECLRAPGTHLIGRDLMYALCHAEYLVFMAAGRLRPETAAKLRMLRLMRRSGAPGSGAEEGTVGYGRRGLEGYHEALEHVYAMFGLPVDRSALEFNEGIVKPPEFSFALQSANPGSIEQYAAQLWDLSTKHSEGTFSALYFFTTVWFMEVGNVGGSHIFPLRVRDREGDVITQRVLWRQALWAACISQLIAVSPMLFGLFCAGFVSVPRGSAS